MADVLKLDFVRLQAVATGSTRQHAKLLIDQAVSVSIHSCGRTQSRVELINVSGERKFLCDSHRHIGYIMSQLYHLNIWPLMRVDQTLSLESLAANLRLVRDSDRSVTCGCRKNNMQEEFHYLLQNFDKEKPGLCVICVRRGKFTRESGNCQSDDVCRVEPQDDDDGEGQSYSFLTHLERMAEADKGRRGWGQPTINKETIWIELSDVDGQDSEEEYGLEDVTDEWMTTADPPPFS